MNTTVAAPTTQIYRVFIKASPERVFQAFADQKKKDAWFGGGSDWTPVGRSFDFREGGKEHAAGRWKTGVVSKFDCIYLDIIPNQRIIYSYVMHLDDRKISVSQAAIELKPDNGGTKFTLNQFKGQKNVMLVFYPLDWTPT